MIQVVGNRLPHGATSEQDSPQSSNAALGGKEPTRMKNRAESVHTTTNETAAPERAKGWRKWIAVGALAPLALSGCATESNAEPQPSEAVEVEDTTSPEALQAAYEDTLLRGEALTEHFEIPAGLSDEELGQVFIDRLDEWENYGANEAFVAWRDAEDGSVTLQERIDGIAAENALGVIPGFVIDDWQERGGELSRFLPRMEQSNAAAVGFNYQTSIDEESYRAWRNLIRVEAVPTPGLADEDGRHLEIEYTVHANTDKNRAHELGMTEGLTPEGSLSIAVATFSEVDGNEYLSNIYFR